MSSCDEHRANISLLIDGELAQEDHRNLVAHFEQCASCRSALQDEQALSARIRAARPRIAAPDSLRASIERMLRAAAVSTPATRRMTFTSPHLWLRPLLAVAAILILIAGSTFAFHKHRQDRNEVVIQAATTAHQQLRDRVVPLDIISDSPEAVTSWFASRVSFPFRMANAGIASDLRANYKLDGGRLLTIGDDRVAVVSFHMLHEQVSMLVAPQRLLTASGGKVVVSGGIALHSRDRDSIHTVMWNNRGLGYVLSANTSMSNPHTCATCHEGSQTGANTGSRTFASSLAPWSTNGSLLSPTLKVADVPAHIEEVGADLNRNTAQ